MLHNEKYGELTGIAPGSGLIHSTRVMVVPSHFVAADRIQDRCVCFTLYCTPADQITVGQSGQMLPVSLEGSPPGSGASSRFIRYLGGGGVRVIHSTNKVSLEREDVTPESMSVHA